MTRSEPLKYDRIAADFSTREYRNLDFYMQHRADLAMSWGPHLQAGDRVLELCCGDGRLACLLAAAGLDYHGVDFSAEMIAQSETRMRAAGQAGAFTVAAIDDLPDVPAADCVLAFARTFFHYSTDPEALLRKLRRLARKKIIVDFDPRKVQPGAAMMMLRNAGFRRVGWRPFLVPQKRQLPGVLLRALIATEPVPMIRRLPLRWRFHCLVKGEC